MTAIRCRICEEKELATPEEQAGGVCGECQKLPGFFKLPPTSRAFAPCRECGGRELIRAVAFERGAEGSDYTTAYAAPLAVAFRQSVKRTFWAMRAVSVGVHEQDVARPVGWLELLICRACGLVIWHALEPHKIPIGPEYGTELVRAGDEGGPYR